MSELHLFGPGSFNKFRVKDFMPPMKTLNICSALEGLSYRTQKAH